jgi:hypothetical protein
MIATGSSPLLRSFLRVLGIAVTALAFGCGEASAPPPSLESCHDGWQPLTEPRPLFDPRQLLYHDGELIYSATRSTPDSPEQSGIEAQPVAGGPPRIITDADAWTLWIEGGQVVFATGDQLQQVPVGGGTPTTIYGGRDPGQTHDVFAHALTPTTFVWSELVGITTEQAEIWSVPRAGGDARMVATFETPAFFERMEVAGDSVVMADMGAHGRVVPLDGSETRPLASPGAWLAGVEPDGVYGFDVAGQPPNEDVHMRFAPMDGSAARPFWTDIPPNVGPDHIWADGDGGWLVSAIEKFDDGIFHRSVFLIDAQGHARRAACNSDPASVSYATARPAFAPDAAYVIYEELADVEHATWRIVKVSR